MKPVNVHPYGIFDNSVKHEYRHIEVKPYTSAMGAEICGVDLTHLSDVQAEEIKDALAEKGPRLIEAQVAQDLTPFIKMVAPR